jgi:acetyl/propionyl-CoA carboxylase alpha subunit
MADEYGNAIHLGERECSIQRRHQKIIEETPSVALTPDLRRQMGEAAVKLVKAAGYVNAGTVEMLFDGNQYYFLEVNARLQVEHPVTEFATGEDLVAWQLRVASGESLPRRQEDISPRGHAIECRIYAEDPANDFLPSSGSILILEEPHLPGVRVDSGIRPGSDVSVYYDPILSKVIAYADTRDRAIEKMKLALDEYVLLGIATPIELLHDVLDHPEFRAGNLTTHFLDDHLPNWRPRVPEDSDLACALLAAAHAPSAALATDGAATRAGIPSPWNSLGAWRIGGVKA